jgi:hypothetical protein
MGTEMLWLEQPNKTYNGYSKKAQHRRHMTFHATHVTSATELPPFATPVDVLQTAEQTG